MRCFSHRRSDRRPALPAFAAALIAATVTGCAVNPATGERMLSLVGEADEIELGREADQAIVAEAGLYPDTALQRYVSDLGLQLAAASERPDLPWTFRVLDDPAVNAFALPGGFIYVTRGILAHMTSEAQLVGVLGHEIGHVTARHGVDRMSRARLAQLGLGIGMVLSETVRDLGDVLQTGTGLLFLKFSRDDEREADRLGVRYMTRLGYEPVELARVMGMLGRASELSSPGRVPGWLSTHPEPEDRFASITAMVGDEAEPGARRVERDGFIRRLDGLVFGPDPRQGFVDGGWFRHPELAFRVSTEGGSVINERERVRFVAADERALVQLTLAGEPPDAALARLERDEGLRVGAAQAVTVSGWAAVQAPIEVPRESGTLEGQVLLVEADAGTLQLLGVWAARGEPSQWVAAVQNSVAPETDPVMLRRQADRLELVRLERDTPFARFLEEHPSALDAERAALINQVERTDTLQSGLWKRVAAGS